jgi:hypothetical protein
VEAKVEVKFEHVVTRDGCTVDGRGEAMYWPNPPEGKGWQCERSFHDGHGESHTLWRRPQADTINIEVKHYPGINGRWLGAEWNLYVVAHDYLVDYLGRDDREEHHHYLAEQALGVLLAASFVDDEYKHALLERVREKIAVEKSKPVEGPALPF